MQKVTVALLLGLAAAQVQNEGVHCHVQCHMDGHSGRCRTSFCGAGAVGCCKLGYEQPPCDGLIGCHGVQCCASMTPSPSAPPPPPPLPPPPGYGADEQALVLSSRCGRAALSFDLGKQSEVGGVVSSQGTIGVTPWLDGLRVTLLLYPRGESIEVMEVDGARLVQREGRKVGRVEARSW